VAGAMELSRDVVFCNPYPLFDRVMSVGNGDVKSRL
jgi:hypothetical protein